jgi:hypothetical protein
VGDPQSIVEKWGMLAMLVLVGVATLGMFFSGLRPVWGVVAEARWDSSSCPMPTGSEQPFDPECVDNLLGRWGPLAVAMPEIAVSFVLGVCALALLASVIPKRRRVVVVAPPTVAYLVFWLVLLMWNSGEIDRHAGTGWSLS